MKEDIEHIKHRWLRITAAWNVSISAQYASLDIEDDQARKEARNQADRNMSLLSIEKTQIFEDLIKMVSDIATIRAPKTPPAKFLSELNRLSFDAILELYFVLVKNDLT